MLQRCLTLLLVLLGCLPALGIERPDVVFKIFQFPANMIPRVDGFVDDWEVVPEDYAIDTEQLTNDNRRGSVRDAKDLAVRVRVGWVKGLNRLYFLYEAYDDTWDFARSGLTNDILELVVDGDMSGGGLIEKFHPEFGRIDPWDLHFSYHGVTAQNYHIFTPAVGKDWALAWGCNQYIKELPYANAAYHYDFKNGESGRLILEFWITPFDYAGCEGPSRAVESSLYEDKLIGMSWAVLDYDGGPQTGFWNLSPKHTMYGNASELLAFRLMPLEGHLRKPIDAKWSFQIVDMRRRLVAFKDLSEGNISSWTWDFGDGKTSSERHPIHTYENPGEYIVTLYVDGPAGRSQLQKIWDVVLR